MRFRVAACAGLTVALALGSCGHSSKPEQPPVTPKPRHDPAPFGRLSRDEYRAIVREYTLMEPLRKGTGNPSAMANACRAAKTPYTDLMTLVRRDCANALDYFSALKDLEKDPTNPALYARVSETMRAIVGNALQINKELKGRGIEGLCARSIGIPRSQVVSMTAGAVAASEAAAAARQGDAVAFLRAQHLLSDALAKEPSGDPLDGIKSACKNYRSKRRQPSPRKPHIPAPGEGINA